MTRPTCPHGAPLDDATIRECSRWLGQQGAASGQQGGRPRSKKKRCACGANTLTRAKARGFDCCKAAGVTTP